MFTLKPFQIYISMAPEVCVNVSGVINKKLSIESIEPLNQQSEGQQCVTDASEAGILIKLPIAMKNATKHNKLHHQMFLIITQLEFDRGFIIIMHHIASADVKTQNCEKFSGHFHRHQRYRFFV